MELTAQGSCSTRGALPSGALAAAILMWVFVVRRNTNRKRRQFLPTGSKKLKNHQANEGLRFLLQSLSTDPVLCQGGDPTKTSKMVVTQVTCSKSASNWSLLMEDKSSQHFNKAKEVLTFNQEESVLSKYDPVSKGLRSYSGTLVDEKLPLHPFLINSDHKQPSPERKDLLEKSSGEANVVSKGQETSDTAHADLMLQEDSASSHLVGDYDTAHNLGHIPEKSYARQELRYSCPLREPVWRAEEIVDKIKRAEDSHMESNAISMKDMPTSFKKAKANLANWKDKKNRREREEEINCASSNNSNAIALQNHQKEADRIPRALISLGKRIAESKKLIFMLVLMLLMLLMLLTLAHHKIMRLIF